MFTFTGDNSTKICGASSIDCYRRADEKLFGEDVIIGLKDDVARSFREQCNCLPSCTQIIYTADVDRAKFGFDGMKKHSRKIYANKYLG